MHHLPSRYIFNNTLHLKFVYSLHFIYTVNHIFVSVWTHRYFICQVIILTSSFAIQIVPAWTIGNIFHLAPFVMLSCVGMCVCVCVCEREGGVGGRGRLVTFGTTNLYFLLNPSINLLLRILSTFYGKILLEIKFGN